MNKIKNIALCSPLEGNKDISFSFQYYDHYVEISVRFQTVMVLNEFTFEIEFDSSIEAWRNHDYTWVDCKTDRIANYYSPKILRLTDGTKVVAGSTNGIWHYKNKHASKLYWSLVKPGSNPLFQYGENNIRNFINVGHEFKGALNFKLYFTRGSVMEWSRSLIPFSGILCFTDHCDFDTLLLLKKQRELFMQNKIKVTKGFFQYHFSKRADNTSFDKPEERDEYLNWIKDGHEMAYHSLSQSKKAGDEPFEDFDKFGLPDTQVVTWIDHGYQPYNFTQIQNHSRHYNMQKWIKHVKHKGIRYLWNYLDSGEASIGIINQISQGSFTYNKAISARKHLPMLKRISESIRIYLFYYSDETILMKYRQMSSSVKDFASKKQVKDLLKVFYYMIRLSRKIISALFPGKITRSIIPHFAVDTPCVFEIYPETENSITVFQTLAVKDFTNTFSPENLELLSKEGGLCIAHTYFAFLEAHHTGKMFLNSRGDISNDIKETFQNIGQSIKKDKIWNPTFKELANYFDVFKHIEYEFNIDTKELIIKDKPEISAIPLRII